MARLTENLVININIHPTTRLNPAVLTKFETLTRITTTSIEGEKDACDREKAYAQVASPWIPVKCYYLLYYLESVFLFLLNSSTIGFSHGGHSGVKRSILALLQDGTISLSGVNAGDLSTIITWVTANGYTAAPGSTISANYHGTTSCSESLRKKLAEYIEIDWKQSSRIINYRTLAARAKKTTELLPKEFCLLDYFYWMRIKANYRDIDFLDFDNDVNEDDSYEYLTYYIRSTDQYSSALSAAITRLKLDRGM